MSEEVLSDHDHGRTYGIAYHGRTRTSYVSTRSKKRKSEPAPRSEWTAVPVSLEGSGLEREMVESARTFIADNRAPSKVGDRFWELSRGILFCADCGRSMSATGRRLPERGTAYYHYRCDGPHQARGTVLPCPNRRCHHATALEFHAASLFEKSASYETLLELYDHALEEERNETGDLSRTQEKHAKLSERLAALAAMRERFQRQEAEGLMTLDELRAHLAEIEEEKGRLTVELRTVEDEAAAARRIEAARDSLSGASGYNPVHAEWYEDPDATQPDEVLTLATSPEDIRRTYRRYGARFEVDNEGELTLKLDLALDGGVLSLTSSRT